MQTLTQTNLDTKVFRMHRFRSITLSFVVLAFGIGSAPLISTQATAAETSEAPESPEAPTAAAAPEAPSPEAPAPEAPSPEAPTAKADAPAPTEQVTHGSGSELPMKEIQHMPEPTDEKHRNVFNAFRERFPSLPIDSIADAPYPGLFEIITDSQIVYVDEGLKLLFQGEMINLDDGINLTEARLAGIHMGLINELGEENMLVYKAANESERTITVFTDINCGYCRLLHSEIDTLLQAGVNVRYLMFPRAGLESESRTALESVWCADNPQEAMTAAKAGEPIVEKSCETPVETHVELAGKVGLRGTPLIYLDNGTALPGYREASVIVEMINSSEPTRPMKPQAG